MKIEICDNTFWLSIRLAILSTVVGLTVIGCNYYANEQKVAMTSGYQETQRVGAQGTMWVKTK